MFPEDGDYEDEEDIGEEDQESKNNIEMKISKNNKWMKRRNFDPSPNNKN